ncbi:hypothetical protein BY996DRAFT_6532759 [Phakopsora pachyrhizi]|nr:hypothetical protein BY996DRAFT_6532759 [Phakopsora pachyrhizi]
MPPKTSARGRYPLRVSLRARNIPHSPETQERSVVDTEPLKVIVLQAHRHLPPTPYTRTIPGFLPDTPNPGNELQEYSTHKDIKIGLKKPGNKFQSVQSHSTAKAGAMKRDSPARESLNTEYPVKQV